MQSVSTALVATFWRRVAIERMYTRWLRSEFMRMRSPSSAPPVRRRVGSTETTAMRICGKQDRKRLSSSSVTELLPAPPVPVMPMTGVGPAWPAAPAAHCLRSMASSASEYAPSSIAESTRPMAISSSSDGRVPAGWRASAARASRALDTRSTTSSIISTRPSFMPSLGW
ncbi:hypothetical protein L599_004200000050 [Luteimonas sp. J16]|nr:hypothetical protein L599_004200000050 [Luteimonas sp. J16]